jgi:transposase-like protein
MGPKLDAGKQARWLKLVRRWQRSNLSVRAFCRLHEISENNFYAWRRVLRERGLLGETPTPALATPTFVQLLHGEAPAAEAEGFIEVVLGRRVLRVRPGFDGATLRQLLALLEEPSC